jgi:FkbM family methyltransferase
MHWLLIKRLHSEVIVTTQICDGVSIQYPTQGNVSRDLYLGQFEHDVIDFLSYYLKPGMIVFDVGANIGVYSLLSAKYVGEHGTVHSFEPTPDIFSRLCANVKLNGFICIHPNQLAVAEKSGTSTFYLYKHNGMNSLARQDWVGEPLGQIEVKTISIDEYVCIKGLNKVDLLKIDVEGAELAVLKGARSLLCSVNPPIVVCEFCDKTTRNFGYQVSSLRDFLESVGYQLFRWNSKSKCLVPEPIRRDYIIYANLVGIRQTD